MKMRHLGLGLLALLLPLTLPQLCWTAAPEYFYLNAARVNLHQLPLFSSPVTGSGQFNDRLAKLGDSPQGWTKVRNLRNGNVGWLPSRYLSRQLVTGPPPAPPRPKKRPQRAVQPAKEPPPAEKAPEPLRPKPM